MQKIRTILIIRAMAIITAATALYTLSQSWRYYRFLMRFLMAALFQRRAFLEHISSAEWILTLIFALVLVLKLVASYGLFRLHLWARGPAIVVLLFDYALGLIGAIRLRWYAIFSSEPPPIKKGMVVAGYVSLWPTYIIAFVGIVFVFFLTREWLISQLKGAST